MDQTIRVLLVEDDPGQTRLVRDSLAGVGSARFEVVEVPRLADALDRLRCQRFDAVLLDFSLPDSLGLATFAHVFAESPDVPIIVLSDDADDQFAVTAVLAGAQDYLVRREVTGPLLARSLRYAIERNRAQKARHHSEMRYRSLFENTQTGVLFGCLNGQVLDCNHAFAHLLGYESREGFLAHTRWVHPFPPGQRDEHLAALRKKGSEKHLESCLCRRDGCPVWVLGNLSLLEIEDGATILQGIFIDLSGRKQLEDKLRQSQKMEAIGRLAGGVAHDFNNLLTVIRGFSELMLYSLKTGDPLRANAEEVKNAADRATALTRHLLAFSRKQTLQFRLLDLNAVVGDMKKLLPRLIGEDIEILFQPDPIPGKIKADPGQIEQVLLNLVVNARDAMPRGGRLTIATGHLDLRDDASWRDLGARKGRYVTLTVQDTGCGMSQETLSHLFEPFFTTKETGKGTGLGLSTVYGIVKQCGGHIDVRSEPGRGATFRILFPRAIEDALRRVPAPSIDARSGPCAGGETLLLVEDEPLVCQVSSLILKRQGYRVLQARSGDEALRLGRAHPDPIHLLVTDVVMPQMSGCELAEILSPERPEMKVLYLSGYSGDAMKRHGLAEGKAAFLNKPFTPDGLTRKVREVLDQRGNPSRGCVPVGEHPTETP